MIPQLDRAAAVPVDLPVPRDRPRRLRRTRALRSLGRATRPGPRAPTPPALPHPRGRRRRTVHPPVLRKFARRRGGDPGIVAPGAEYEPGGRGGERADMPRRHRHPQTVPRLPHPPDLLGARSDGDFWRVAQPLVEIGADLRDQRLDLVLEEDNLKGNSPVRLAANSPNRRHSVVETHISPFKDDITVWCSAVCGGIYIPGRPCLRFKIIPERRYKHRPTVRIRNGDIDKKRRNPIWAH